ncbi:hypothetical protein [Streptomyces sp. YU58]|uniref:hypothetical protein n=1 Tax=Streptomyces sp. SX92 TaxID=3158972 RepID=UPI0027B9FE48|nr:hypothetical protein [Streptomyces coralus]WLW53225.1 hypothetical protein QU709_18375 [Streptomyces coralus]
MTENPQPRKQDQESTYSGEALEFIKKIEGLALKLVNFEFGDTFNLWKFQLDLLELQREIQKSVSEEKKRAKKLKGKSESLKELQMARWLARRLGDSLAWTLLRFDTGSIYPFANNDPVPIAQKSHGSEGMLAVSAHLAKEGWGFPLLHDVTDVMRIGDVTFIKPENRHRTIEVKTRHLGTTTDRDGKTSTQYDVAISFLGSRDSKLELEIDADRASAVGDQEMQPLNIPEKEQLRADRRIAQQTRRMANVLTLKEADLDTVFEVDGKKTIATRLDTPSESKWSAIRALIDEAKNEGYASTALDSSCMYVALYNKHGITPDLAKNEQIAHDVKRIVSSSGKHQNSLTLSMIPEEGGRGAHLYLPFYLYDIPPEAIADLIHGRLLIIALVNAGSVATLIEQDGVEVTLPPGKDPLSSMTFSYIATDGHGNRYRAEVHELGLHVREYIYEFRGIDYLRGIVHGMRGTFRTVADQGFIGD